MIGKIRGFLILFLVFIVLGIGLAVLAYVNLDRTLTLAMRFAGDAFPFVESDKVMSRTGDMDDNLEAAKMFTDAAYEALKSGKAKPGDLLELGQLYYQAKNDGHLDKDEMGQMIELADKTGIIDAVIDQALTPVEDVQPRSRAGAPSLEAQLQGLITGVEQARADGQLDTGELMGLLQQARESGLQNQIVEMMPPDYDQTRARTAVLKLAKAVVIGKTSINDTNMLMDMVLRAQADGRLEHQELDRITQTAERLVP